MGFIAWIIFGLLVGALAKWIMPGKDPKGCLVTMLIGVVGAMLGGFISTQLGFGDVTSIWDFESWIIAVLGAVLLLWLWRVITKGKA
jgi:uncharacterized membrane protein YeaQ/YmgE (transglycosylase-associated protein family)